MRNEAGDHLNSNDATPSLSPFLISAELSSFASAKINFSGALRPPQKLVAAELKESRQRFSGKQKFSNYSAAIITFLSSAN
jgi:hypothetical protein